MPERTIFFSWQADTPTKEGRNLVEWALERAVARIGEDTAVEDALRDELVVDRDTKGVPGSPPIVDTIFRKIDQAAVFVPDLTFVGQRRDGRPTPNPNVLIEYGWALKSLGHGRIVPVMNTASGKPAVEAMPFDMRHLRNPIQYDCPADADEAVRKQARDDLSKTLERAIRDILSSEPFRQTLPAPLPFPVRDPQDGPARFRAHGEVVGIGEHPPGQHVKVAEGPAFWLRVLPLTDQDQKWSASELRKLAAPGVVKLLPLNRQFKGYNFVRGHDGFGVAATTDASGATPSLVYVFTNGEVWSIDVFRVVVSSGAFDGFAIDEGAFAEALDGYTGFLADQLGFSPPFRWIAGIQNVKGAGLWVPARPGWIPTDNRPLGSCMLDPVQEEGLHSPPSTALKSLRPFFIKVYESCGIERPGWLDSITA